MKQVYLNGMIIITKRDKNLINKIMKITENDIDILPGCVIIETLNKERDVNKLMYP